MRPARSRPSLLIAGAGGSAIAADLGARKIREELDAMMVLGIDPIQRLVVPRVLACMLVAVFLNGLVSVVGVAGGYFFNVVLQDGTPGRLPRQLHGAGPAARPLIGMAKALVFGLIAAIVASYKGMNAGGGPKGVGDAVNESVVITFMLLFVVNFVMSAIYFQLVPPKTGERDGELQGGLRAAPHHPGHDGRGARVLHARARATPRSVTRYPKEILRLLAEVTLGLRRARRHRRHGRRHHRDGVLHRRRGRPRRATPR